MPTVYRLAPARPGEVFRVREEGYAGQMYQDGGGVGPLPSPNHLGRPVLWLGLDSEKFPPPRMGRKVGDLECLTSFLFSFKAVTPITLGKYGDGGSLSAWSGPGYPGA